MHGAVSATALVGLLCDSPGRLQTFWK